MTYTVIISQDPEEDREVYNARIPALPGCVAWGETIDEALTAISEVLDLYLRDYIESGAPLPPDVYCEQHGVAV